MIGEGRDITALLGKYYAVSMIAAKEGYSDEDDLPASIPDMMVRYVRLINRKCEQTGPDTTTIIKAAEVIAWECLKSEYRPMPAKIDDVLKALSRKQRDLLSLHHIKNETEKSAALQQIMRHLEGKLKLIQHYGAEQDHIRFMLDTLSEYLAGLYLIKEYGNDKTKWSNFLASTDEKVVDRKVLHRAFNDTVIDRRDNMPEAILSFLLALHDCCYTNEALGSVPTFVTEELKRKIKIRRIIKELRSPDQEERWRAMQELDQIELRDLSWARKLIVPMLIELLIDSSLKISEAAKKVLINLGILVEPELELASTREDSDVGITALQLLAKIRR
jgi:hypothetical protein